MDEDTLPFGTPSPEAAISTAKPRRHRHEYERGDHMAAAFGVDGRVNACAICGAIQDPAASRRNRNNKKRGNRLSARASRDAGLTNLEALGLPVDGGTSTEWLVLQHKSGGSYPLLIDRWLRALTPTASQLRGVVSIETPGPGHRAKRLITLDYDEFLDWFGPEKVRKP